MLGLAAGNTQTKIHGKNTYLELLNWSQVLCENFSHKLSQILAIYFASKVGYSRSQEIFDDRGSDFLAFPTSNLREEKSRYNLKIPEATQFLFERNLPLQLASASHTPNESLRNHELD